MTTMGLLAVAENKENSIPIRSFVFHSSSREMWLNTIFFFCEISPSILLPPVRGTSGTSPPQSPPRCRRVQTWRGGQCAARRFGASPVFPHMCFGGANVLYAVEGALFFQCAGGRALICVVCVCASLSADPARARFLPKVCLYVSAPGLKVVE